MKVVEPDVPIHQDNLHVMLYNNNKLEVSTIWIVKHYKYNLTNEFYGDRPL
jgi:hypothetical protein